MTAADKYYLKARDCYPYEMEQALDALAYGLSADDAHPALLTLQGEIFYKALCRFTEASDCFSWAIYHAPGYLDAWYLFIELQLTLEDFANAESLITRALAVPGINKGRIWHAHALLSEKQGNHEAALALIKQAIGWTTQDDETEFYGKEKARIKKKLKRSQPQNEKTPVPAQVSAPAVTAGQPLAA